MARTVVFYSEAFKRHVVEQLESGKIASLGEANARFGIAGAMTVRRWLRKYGKNHLLPRIVRVETPDERDALKDLKKEVADLKRALADSHMEAVLYRNWFDVACREFGVQDVAAFKKKLEERRSS